LAAGVWTEVGFVAAGVEREFPDPGKLVDGVEDDAIALIGLGVDSVALIGTGFPSL
jgi:hypothetical protein